MLPYKRADRVGDLLREEVSEIIIKKIKDPRVGFVTVTAVKVTDDLSIARVYITILDKSQEAATLSALRAASGFIRSELKKRLRMKVIPKIEFRKDETYEKGVRIDELLRKIREEGGEGS